MLDTLRKRIAAILLPTDLKSLSTASPELASLFHGITMFGYGQPVYTDLTVSKATREGYKFSVYVYRAVRTIIQAASGIPWIVVDKDGEPIENHPFIHVIENPNHEFSGQDLIEFLVAHLKLTGNALWKPIIAGGQIREIWTVMPDLIQPIPSKEKGEWLKGYQVTNPLTGSQDIVKPETFIHFMEMDPGNLYWGTSPLMAAARTIDADNEAQDTQKVSMQNRGMPSGIFSPSEPMTQEQFEEARRVMKETYLDKVRRREPWLVSAPMTWTETSLTPVEMDYIASRLQNKRDIAAAFGISPIFLGDLEQSSYNNMMEARKALYEDCVIPMLDDIRATINLKVAPLYGEDIYITYDTSNVAALREDFGKKVEQAFRLWSMGVPFKQINTQLEMGFEDFPGCELGYLPLSVLPVGAPALTELPEGKALNLLTEDSKAAHWKRIDRRRIAYWAIVAKKVQALYDGEGDAIAKALRGAKPVEVESKAVAAIESLRHEWEAMLTAIMTALVEDFGKEIAKDLGGDVAKAHFIFNPFKPSALSWIAAHAAASVNTILETNKADVRFIILQGFEGDLPVARMASQIRGFYTDRSMFKAMRVARTEVGAAAGFGQREAASQSGIVKTKKWVSSRDDRVRDSHLEIDGQERPLDEIYSNGLMYPGDPSGDPAEFIMCRCVETYHSGR